MTRAHVYRPDNKVIATVATTTMTSKLKLNNRKWVWWENDKNLENKRESDRLLVCTCVDSHFPSYTFPRSPLPLARLVLVVCLLFVFSIFRLMCVERLLLLLRYLSKKMVSNRVIDIHTTHMTYGDGSRTVMLACSFHFVSVTRLYLVSKQKTKPLTMASFGTAPFEAKRRQMKVSRERISSWERALMLWNNWRKKQKKWCKSIYKDK